ncbi:natural resistance-associated macrophage protein-domain-containing protein [Syncephalastrum racemosum]|uniref:Natural resistance-associated macrophage protein-domain-containing protein n=1 Tax=Syncephalastrum racemosum TaxID=13706 RepID=A0A1X2HQB5_SYNRA|nr:natural resistance-associated macrophage protein-domain-containing protein [Syncephalastrum racemosum]
MVPHENSRLPEDLDDDPELSLLQLDDFQPHHTKRHHVDSDSPIHYASQSDDDSLDGASLGSERGRRRRRRSDDLEIKPEINTGSVSDSCFSFKKLWKYTGPGWLMSIAYLDPGNLESDLQAGAVAGYSLLWLLFWAHLIGLVFQLLSARLGTVTGRHLAQLIRQSYSRRMTVLLWGFAQCAIVGADIMEIIGTAIALHILLRLPLWAGVLMTAIDTFTFMMIQRYGMRKMEAFFLILILVMTTCFWVEMVASKPDVPQILKGIAVPVVPRGAVVQAVGMLGAVVMPHNMFLHSALVGSRDLGPNPSVSKRKEANFYFGIESGLALFLSFLVNLAIVVVFAQVFYKPDAVNVEIPGLGDADAVLRRTLGSAAQYLWAAGLLAAGQSSTMTGTFAGQYVTEGFFGNVFKKEWHRVAITRGVSLIPSMLVAIFAVDHFDNMGELLNVLQSVCLPPVLIPILKLSASSAVMSDEFKSSTLVYCVCWVLTAIVVAFNSFLCVSHITGPGSLTAAVLFGTVYMTFLGWLIWTPVDYRPEGSNEWTAIPGQDEEEGLMAEEIYLRDSRDSS